jgi:pimeloyl-ACP methyl ester carboxylesterase
MLMTRAINKAFFNAYREDQPIRARLEGVADLMRHGYIDNAWEIIQQLNQSEGQLQPLEWLSWACDRLEMLRPAPYDDPNAVESITVDGLNRSVSVRPPTDVMIARSWAATRVIVAFGGVGEAFWSVPPFLEVPNCHLVLLRDTTRLFHVAGIEGLGDSYAECVVALRKLIQKLGATQVFVTGNSSGGYAALRYALDLEVRGVLAFSPFTRINASEDELAKFPALRPLSRSRPEMMEDLLPLYTSHPNPPKAIIVYGDKHVIDTEQALRMENVPGVTLEPVHGYDGHHAWAKLLDEQRFRPLLKRLLSY